MIIGTKFLHRHLWAIRCVECVVETIVGTIRILGRNKPTMGAAEVDVDIPNLKKDKPTDPVKEALTEAQFEWHRRLEFPR